MTLARHRNLEEQLATLPARPGVYLMKDTGGKIIYVGKAKKLSARVRSYFRGRHENPKVAALVARIADFEYIVTDSEVEALLLEHNLIKEHHPRYNVDLKDDKRYPYLKVTVAEPFPRAFITRKYARDGSRYFGPYTDAGALRTTLECLRKVFPVRSCKYRLPEQRGPRECLNYFLGRCSGPCHGHISQQDYRAVIDEMLMFLEGKTAPIEKRLKQQMEQATEKLAFEQAAVFRDQLAAVRKVSQRQKMDAIGGRDRDVLAVAIDGYDACGVILKVRKGKLLEREHYYLRNSLGESPAHVLAAFIGQNYLADRSYPAEVLLSHQVKDRRLIETVLSARSDGKVRLQVPQRGEKASLVALAGKNSHLLLEELILRKEKSRQRVPEALVSLQKTLGLPWLPRTMVCFDVSNLGVSYAVASMSFFQNGQPKKSMYRKFRIKSVEGQDDFAMIGEAVGRYFARVADGELKSPHLVVIDGGKGQLAAALEAIKKQGLEAPPVVALAKKEEELFLPGKSQGFVLSKRSEAIKILQRLRDEAHRFAVAYHRRLRSRESLKGRLEKIPGIGPARSRALIQALGSVTALKKAGWETLASVEGISPAMARKIIEHLKENGPDAENG